MLSFILLMLSTTAIFPSIECLTEPQQPPFSHNTTKRGKNIIGDEYKKLATLGYTKHAISNISGDHCMTDCVNNYCLTEKERVETCQVDERRKFVNPMIYYTANRYGIEFCFSKCSKDEKDLYHCYIGNNYEKDYCNPVTNQLLKADIFESDTKVYNNPCRNKCEKRGSARHSCDVKMESSKRVNCNPDELFYYEYMNKSSWFKQPCFGACGKWGQKYYSCTIDKTVEENVEWTWDYCAPVAHEFGICKHCGIKDQKDVQKYIKDVEGDKQYTKIIVNDSSTSITSYNYKTAPDGTRLPVVVKAVIRRKHIREQEVIKNIIDKEAIANCGKMTTFSNCNKYVFGNLVSYKHGGSGAFYNVVPLSKHLNFGTQKGDFITPSVWIDNERRITNYVYVFDGVVEQNIAIFYDPESNSHTPVAIGRYIRVVDRAVSSALWECENVHSNDPDYGQECDSF